MKQIGYKYCDIELKDLDQEKGIVAFYFSPFGISDIDNDETMSTTFDKTFSESKGRVKHFRNHDKKEVPGTIIQLSKDTKGAYAVSQLALKTITGKDTFEQYKAGVITEHSYGFEEVKADRKEKGGRILKEVKLWEVSSLTHWGANQDTPTISMKSYEEVSEQLARINILLTKGNPSDELGEKMLKEYKMLYDFMEKKKLEAEQIKKPKGLDFDYLVKNF